MFRHSMVLLGMVVVLAVVSGANATGRLSVDVTSPSKLSINVNGEPWLSSTDVAFHSDAHGWASAAAGSLKPTGNSSSSGTDGSLGPFTRKTFSWVDANGATYQTHIDSFTQIQAVVLEQVWQTGTSNASVGDKDGVAGGFPTLDTSASSPSSSLGVVGFRGAFIDDGDAGEAVGKFPDGLVTGLGGGPMVFFAGNGSGDALVVSPLTNFMSSSWAKVNGGSNIGFGPMGDAHEIPAGFSFRCLVTLGTSSGINNAMSDWGSLLLKYYGKTTTAAENDFTLNNLGYSTDHGTYYYYNTGSYANMEEAMLAVKNETEKLNLPVKHILLDSWWYYRGKGNGVSNWTVRPDIFPPGGNAEMGKLVKTQLKWPVVGHNRYWASDNVYATYNGGKYQFSAPTPGSDMVVPLEQAFWNDLLSTGAAWGLHVYEQDWLYNELEGVPMLTQNVTMGETWLTQMGNAASANELNIQYCMPYPRHAMMSVKVPPVTQIRASQDFVPGWSPGETQWKIGGSSILAHSLGLRPSKDGIWSSPHQPGGSCGSVFFAGYLREAAISTLSNGPVTPADGVSFFNRSVIMRACRDDGLLLRPARPVVSLDETFGETAFGGGVGPAGVAYATYSLINGVRYDHVLSTEMKSNFALKPDSVRRIDPAVTAADDTSSWLAYKVDTVSLNASTLQVQEFSAASPITLLPGGDNDFDLWHTSPMTSFNAAFLGSLSKWIPTAPQRFDSVNIDDSTNSITVTASGTEGEEIDVWFAKLNGKEVDPVAILCKVGSSGKVTATYPAGTCQAA